MIPILSSVLILLALFGSGAFLLSILPAAEKKEAAPPSPPKENDAFCAHVFCSGGKGAKDKYVYDRVVDCRVAASLSGGRKLCGKACTGLGNCLKACPYGAISLKGGVAKVLRERCRGCGACVAACPKDLIAMVPRSATLAVSCSSTDKGADVIRFCETGCIGCKKCEKVCPENAIDTSSGFARIRQDLCTACGACTEVCPRGIIRPL